MNKKTLLATILLLATLASCSQREMAGRHEEKLTHEEARRCAELQWAINFENVGRVKQYMEEGYDPNRSRGEQGYRDRTPLNIVAYGFYNTYVRLANGEEIPDPPPDVAMLQLLVDAGADVNRRPYVWCRVWMWDNWSLNRGPERETVNRLGRRAETEAEMEEYEREKRIEPLYFVEDANRVLEALLRAGADPDKRGHPFPYTREANLNRITDEEADRYFAKGTRPINEAIKKGIRWESQVDLLLQYTALDKDSLKAAKDSKDPAMVEKITKIWNEQNAGRAR